MEEIVKYFLALASLVASTQTFARGHPVNEREWELVARINTGTIFLSHGYQPLERFRKIKTDAESWWREPLKLEDINWENFDR